jgi:glycine receptor alpha-2
MFIYQTWTESRLRLPLDIFEDDEDYVTLPPEFFDNLWQPDPYFLNSKVSGKSFKTIQVYFSASIPRCR